MILYRITKAVCTMQAVSFGKGGPSYGKPHASCPCISARDAFTESRQSAILLIMWLKSAKEADNGKLVTGYGCDSRTADAEGSAGEAAVYRRHRGGCAGGRWISLPCAPVIPNPERSHRKKPTVWVSNLPSGFTKGNHAFVPALT